jgi:hypothetical protein
MAITDDAFLVANRFAERLAHRDADVLYGVMGIDVQIAFGMNIEINLAVPGNLVEHMLEKGQPRIEGALTGAIKT